MSIDFDAIEARIAAHYADQAGGLRLIEARECEIGHTSPRPRPVAATVPDETSNAAVAAGASMARAVLAAEHYRQLGELPCWATNRKDP